MAWNLGFASMASASTPRRRRRGSSATREDKEVEQKQGAVNGATAPSTQNKATKTQVLVLLEPEEVSHAARRAKPNYFDLVLGHDAAAVAAARGRASAPFAHGGTWVPRAVWAAPPRRKAAKASLVCGALRRPKYTKPVSRGDGVVLSIFERVGTCARWRGDDAKNTQATRP